MEGYIYFYNGYSQDATVASWPISNLQRKMFWSCSCAVFIRKLRLKIKHNLYFLQFYICFYLFCAFLFALHLSLVLNQILFLTVFPHFVPIYILYISFSQSFGYVVPLCYSFASHSHIVSLWLICLSFWLCWTCWLFFTFWIFWLFLLILSDFGCFACLCTIFVGLFCIFVWLFCISLVPSLFFYLFCQTYILLLCAFVIFFLLCISLWSFGKYSFFSHFSCFACHCCNFASHSHFAFFCSFAALFGHKCL